MCARRCKKRWLNYIWSVLPRPLPIRLRSPGYLPYFRFFWIRPSWLRVVGLFARIHAGCPASIASSSACRPLFYCNTMQFITTIMFSHCVFSSIAPPLTLPRSLRNVIKSPLLWLWTSSTSASGYSIAEMSRLSIVPAPPYTRNAPLLAMPRTKTPERRSQRLRKTSYADILGLSK